MSRKGSSGMGAGGVSQSDVDKAAREFLTYNLTNGSQYAKFESAKIVSDIGDDGRAAVEIKYETQNRVLVGFDTETGTEEWDTESSYHTNTFKIKVR